MPPINPAANRLLNAHLAKAQKLLPPAVGTPDFDMLPPRNQPYIPGKVYAEPIRYGELQLEGVQSWERLMNHIQPDIIRQRLRDQRAYLGMEPPQPRPIEMQRQQEFQERVRGINEYQTYLGQRNQAYLENSHPYGEIDWMHPHLKY